MPGMVFSCLSVHFSVFDLLFSFLFSPLGQPEGTFARLHSALTFIIVLQAKAEIERQEKKLREKSSSAYDKALVSLHNLAESLIKQD